MSVSAIRQSSLPAKRLVVLVTPNVDELLLARRIWALALKNCSEVLYVAQVPDADEEARLRRALAQLAAITRDDRFHVTTRLAFQASWLKTLREFVQPGDVIVCLGGQTVRRFGRAAVPLQAQLTAEFGEAVRVLDGIEVEPPSARREVWPLIREAMPVAIIAAFLEFQMWASAQMARGAAGTSVLALSVVVEFSLIWLWVSRVH